MDKLISEFTQHLSKAIEIGKSSDFSTSNKKFQNVLICGLGGSGIGGTIASQILKEHCNLPIVINKDYQIPSFVDESSLVIACSYSGNTEETLQMVDSAESKGAEICYITSGGKFAEIAKGKDANIIQIPGNLPPRAAFGYSFPQILFVFEKYGLTSIPFQKDIASAIQMIDEEEDNIRKKAKEVAEKLYKKIPVIYSEPRFEGVSVRFRQQINENSKMLCWHHTIPEMNHNELVGWREKNDDLVPVFFIGEKDYYRNTERRKYSQDVMKKYTSEIIELKAKGQSHIVECLYLMHLGDWISYFLAEKKGVDAVEVNVITGLKDMLSKI